MKYLITSIFINAALLSSYFYVQGYKIKAPKLINVKLKKSVSKKTIARVKDAPSELKVSDFVRPPASDPQTDSSLKTTDLVPPQNLHTVTKNRVLNKRRKGQSLRKSMAKNRVVKLSSNPRAPKKKLGKKRKPVLANKRISSFIKRKKQLRHKVAKSSPRRKITVEKLLSSLGTQDKISLPAYTDEAEWEELEGDVQVDYDVLSNGRVVIRRVRNRSGHRHLAEIVKSKMRGWRLPSFAMSKKQITFQFRLNN